MVASTASRVTTAPKWLNKRLGRFKLVGEIGRGTMGRVFRAQDTTLNRLVALKALPTKTREGRPSPMVEHLVREARAIAGLEHPNIVTVYDVGQASGVCYVAMELIEGGNLEQLVAANGSMDIVRACRLISEAAEALAFAHSAGVIHRDVKPANLMLTRTGRCKVADFGLAKLVDPNESSNLDERHVGTPLFVAPEIIRNKPASAESDIYSLGATLWYLLTGKPVFTGPGKAAVLEQHLTMPVPDLKKIRPDLPDSLIEAIKVSLAKHPSSRYADAEQFGRILRLHTIPVGDPRSANGSSVDLRPPAPRPTPMQNRTKAIGITAAGVALAAVVTIVSYNALVDRQDTRDLDTVVTATPEPADPAPRVAAVPASIQPVRPQPQPEQRPELAEPAPSAAAPQVVPAAIKAVASVASPVIEQPAAAPAKRSSKPHAQLQTPAGDAMEHAFAEGGSDALVRVEQVPKGTISRIPLNNPAFEDPQPGEYMVGWLGGGNDYGVDTTAPRNGTKNAFNGGKWNQMYQLVKVEPNTTYTLRAWARLASPARSELTQCIYVSANLATLHAWVDSTDYQQYTITFRTAADVHQIEFGAGAVTGDAEMAYFDDFELLKHQ